MLLIMSEPAFPLAHSAPNAAQDASAAPQRALRVRSFIGGEILHSNGSSKTQCTIRDISETGARIEVPVSITIPDHFELVVPLKNLREKSRIVWRQGNEIGVVFISREARAEAASQRDEGMGYRVRELEGEIDKLRVQLQLMQTMFEQVLKPRS